jgi:hypothetical protein
MQQQQHIVATVPASQGYIYKHTHQELQDLHSSQTQEKQKKQKQKTTTTGAGSSV